MTTKLGTSALTGIYAGLTNTYSVLANASANGVTKDSISAAQTNTSLTGSLNQTFASYLQTNFSNVDKDGDGKISATEMSDMTSQMSTQGLTQAQLAQLGTASGMSSNTLAQVLDHFNDIDTNKDGKVTTSEISAYQLTSEMQKKKTEFSNRAASNQSVFYGDENASSAADSSSMLDYKFLNDDNNA